MIEPVTIGMIVAGLVLLFFGAALSVYGVALLGFIVGGGGGYLLGPTVGELAGLEGTIAIAASVLVLGIVGAVAAYMMLSITIAGLSFVVGIFLGWVVLAEWLVGGEWYVQIPTSFAIGMGAAMFAFVMTKTALVLVTSFSGAALATRQVTLTNFETAQAEFVLEPLLFEITSPLFLGAFVLGILTQFGLFKFGYVTRIVAVLPGASIVTDRGEEEPA